MLLTLGDSTVEVQVMPEQRRYPGGMIGNVPRFNAENVRYVEQTNSDDALCENCGSSCLGSTTCLCPKCELLLAHLDKLNGFTRKDGAL